MRIISTCVLFLLIPAGSTQAQSSAELTIRLGVYELNQDGGDRALGMWRSTGPVVIGTSVSGTFSFGDTCEAWAVSSTKGDIRDDTTTAWLIEVTPVRVVRDAVTFRMRWVRVTGLKQQLDDISFDGGKAARAPGEDIELTLRPGESWPVDSVRVPSGAKTVHGRPCGSSASIRVLVDHYPSEGDERRLVAADLWLVERLPNGAEAQRSQPLSVRGLPNRPFPFYFDSIVDGNVTLDFYGILTSRLEVDALAVSVETRSRWAPGSPRFSGPQRSVTSDVQVKPAETVEIRLPMLGDQAGPFAKRAFSIRIRARQLR